MRTIHLGSAILVATAGALAIGGCGADRTGGDDAGRAVGAVVAGAAFTTFDEEQGGCLHGDGINCNHYANKEDVYINGGPVAGGLSDGTYYFTVLTPGAQNGGFVQGAVGNLSDDVARGGNDQGIGDSIEDRTFVVDDHEIVDNLGSHDEGESPSGRLVLQLFPYDDTSNNGGVYILAICQLGATSPSQCKYDAFKVEEQEKPPPKPPCCGDGHLDTGEECDDGNTVGEDGCSSTCTTEETPPPPCCGDGHVDAGEQCDDGNTVGEDGCSSTCTTEETPPQPYCGDGRVDAGEQCDDGNTVGEDGCSSTCTTEETPPQPYCGDGRVDAGEQCDDGNTVSGDRCSSSCRLEYITATPVVLVRPG